RQLDGHGQPQGKCGHRCDPKPGGGGGRRRRSLPQGQAREADLKDGQPECPMSSPQPMAFSEADEQLFQKVRNELLAKVETKSVAASWRRFLLSFIWFILLGVLLFTPVELIWLIGVLL